MRELLSAGVQKITTAQSEEIPEVPCLLQALPITTRNITD